MIPAWIDATKKAEIPTGLGVDKALQQALELRDRLRGKTASPAGLQLDAELIETLHALCTLFDQPHDIDPKLLLADCAAAFEFTSSLIWPRGEFGGREDLLSRVAFLCWRYARRAESPAAESRWRTLHSSTDRPNGRSNTDRNLTPTELRPERIEALEGTEQLLTMCEGLWQRGETEPAKVRDEADFFHQLLATSKRTIGLYDEREYFLGELALIAGAACRFLFRREEARRWFDHSEASFSTVSNGLAYGARLAYQRLALALEERRFEEVLELAPVWTEKLTRMGLAEDALKCRFLEGAALRENGRVSEAMDVFREILREAETQRNVRLIAIAANGLAQFCRVLGDLEGAISYARKALPLLQRLNNRANLAKLRWCVGDILREQGKLGEAVVVYRDALESACEVGMRADIAAIHLVLAEVLLDAGQDRQARQEVRAALPIIEEEQMVPEGMAALSLLRGSLRRRQINRQALRDLHSYFREPGS